MKNTFFVLILIFIVSGCTKYENHNEDFLLDNLFKEKDKRLHIYSAVNTDDKILYWNEEFDNNDSKWPADTSIVYTDANVSMENGKMIIDFWKESFYCGLPITINEKRNFELEMRMYWRIQNVGLYQFETPTDSTHCYGVFLRNFGNEILFSLDEIKDEWGGWRHVIRTTNISGFINVNDYNLITIRKIDSEYSVFINEAYIHTFDERVFSCNPTWFVTYEGINKFDYFRVSYLK